MGVSSQRAPNALSNEHLVFKSYFLGAFVLVDHAVGGGGVQAAEKMAKVGAKKWGGNYRS